MKKFFILLIAFFAINIAKGQNCDGWFPPASRSTNSLYYIYFCNSNLGFAVGSSGTVLRTTNAGAKWDLINSGGSELHSVFFPTIDTGYIVGDNSTIMKTTNGGQTWFLQFIYPSTYLNLLSVYFTSSKVGYAVSESGAIIKTYDGGANWYFQASGVSTYLHSIFFTDENTGYIAGGYGKLLKTTNGGGTWTLINCGTSLGLHSVNFINSNIGFVVGGNPSSPIALKTTDAGATWSLLSTGAVNVLYSVHFINPNVGYVSGIGTPALKTIDGGATWSNVYYGSNNGSVYSSSVIDTNTFFFVNNEGEIYKTSNSGIDWFYQLMKHQYFYKIYFSTLDTGYAINLDNIYRSINGGNNWEFYNKLNLSITNLAFQNANTAIGIGYNGQIIKTTNGFKSFIDISTSPYVDLNSVFFANSNIGYIVGNSGTIKKTVDIGTTWTNLTPPTSKNINSVYFTDINTGYVVGDTGLILKTVNGGSNWTLQASGISSKLNSVFFINQNTGFAVGNNGKILKTINSGLNWTLQSSGTTKSLYEIKFSNSNTGIAVGDSGIILKTIDGGLNWYQQVSGTTSSLYNVSFSNSNTAYIPTHNDPNFDLIKTINAGDPVVSSTTTPVGINQRCFGAGTGTYTTNKAVNATTYIWNITPSSAGTISGTDTNGIVVWNPSFIGTANVSVYGTNGICNGLQKSVSVTVLSGIIPIPPAAGVISGDTLICQGINNITYTVPSMLFATSYIWKLPTGVIGTSTNNSITVNYDTNAVSGNITVNGNNMCGNGAASSLAIIVKPLPKNSGAISGSSSVCQNQNSVNYTIPSIANATTYNWILPTGFVGANNINNLIVNFSSNANNGNIKIYGANSCGNSDTSSLAITVNPLPTYSGTFIGDTVVCKGQTFASYAAPFNNATSNIWTIPNGLIGTSTTNTLNLNIDSGFTAGVITVKGYNSCGYSLTSVSRNISVNPLLHSPTVNLGNDTSLLLGNNVILNANNTGATYLWNTGATTNQITVTTTGTYSVIVKDSSQYCISKDTIKINVISVSANFYAPDTVCINSSISLQNQSVLGNTYYWNFKANNITSTPFGANLGNIGSLYNPSCIIVVRDSNNYYAFITNTVNSTLTRLSYGNSMSNSPVGVN